MGICRIRKLERLKDIYLVLIFICFVSITMSKSAQPSHLWHYEVLSRIGQGSMGEIFLCYDPSLDRRLIVKRMQQNLVHSSDLTDRFTGEVRAMAGLDHPSITQIYGFWVSERNLHLSMEYIEGENLRQLMDHGQTLPIPMVIALAESLLRGIDHAHRAGVVHRDLKPSNIMVSYRGQVKILDFGIARMADQEMTLPGTLIGTTAYMAPEQVQLQRAIPASDLFAVGIILYELVFQNHPFRGETSDETLSNICQFHPKFSGAKGYPRFFISIIRQCLKKEPNQRPQSASKILKTLDQKLASWPRQPVELIKPIMVQVKNRDFPLNNPLIKRNRIKRSAPWVVSIICLAILLLQSFELLSIRNLFF
jgi:serine/threonine-protein kinase